MAERARVGEVVRADDGLPEGGGPTAEHVEVISVQLGKDDGSVLLLVHRQECIEAEGVHGQGVGDEVDAHLGLAVGGHGLKHDGGVHPLGRPAEHGQGLGQHGVQAAVNGVEGLKEPRLGVVEHLGDGGVEGLHPRPKLDGVLGLAQGVADVGEGLHGQGVEAVDGALQPSLCLGKVAVHGGRPLVEVPVIVLPAGCLAVEVLDDSLGLYLLVEGLDDGLQLVEHRGGQRNIPRMADVLVHLHEVHAGEGGDGEIQSCGVAEHEQTVVADTLGDQLQGRAGGLGLPEGVVAAEHLVAGVHGVECLLTPGAVLVMLVEALLEGVLADLVDGLAEQVAALVLLVLQRVQGGAQARVMHRGLGGVDKELQITATKAAEGVEPGVAPRLQIDLAEEPADRGAANAVLQMLAEAHVQTTVGRHLQINVQETRGLLSQIHNEEDTVKFLGIRDESHGRAEAHIPGLHHFVGVTPRDGGVLHVHRGALIACGVLEAARAADHAADAGLQGQLPIGADVEGLGDGGHHVALLKAITAEAQKSVVALHIAVVGGTQLTRDQMALARDVVAGLTGQHGLVRVGDDVIVLVHDLKDQPRLTLLVGLGVDAVVPHHRHHAVESRPQGIGDLHTVVDLVVGVVGVLPEGAELTVHPDGVVGIAGDVEEVALALGRNGHGSEEVAELVLPNLSPSPDPGGSL